MRIYVQQRHAIACPTRCKPLKVSPAATAIAQEERRGSLVLLFLERGTVQSCGYATMGRLAVLRTGSIDFRGCASSSDNVCMLAMLSRAAVRYTASIIRRAGGAAVQSDWVGRAEICERCPMRVVVGCVSYCGQPIYRKADRDSAEEGCGCPTREKAKSPDEHCPLTAGHRAARGETPLDNARDGGGCDCKWCARG